MESFGKPGEAGGLGKAHKAAGRAGLDRIAKPDKFDKPDKPDKPDTPDRLAEPSYENIAAKKSPQATKPGGLFSKNKCHYMDLTSRLLETGSRMART